MKGIYEVKGCDSSLLNADARLGKHSLRAVQSCHRPVTPPCAVGPLSSGHYHMAHAIPI